MELPTVKVLLKDTNEEAVINQCDFDEKLHEKVTTKRVALKDDGKSAKKDDKKE